MDDEKLQLLCLVVPCYNEEVILEDSAAKLLDALDNMIRLKLISTQSSILFVDDGSSDRTWEIMETLFRKFPERIAALRFAANRGHQTALLAGLLHARQFADWTISLDVDLQDDISTLPEFVRAARNGAEIVYGVRSDRSSDSWPKRFFANLFYKIMNLMGVNSIPNHADFRLMSKKALDALAEYGEVNIFLRGLIVQLGFPSTQVLYVRKKANRPTHYSIPKMIKLAWDGISSFSVYPIRFISALGMLTVIASFAMMLYILSSKFFGFTVRGWTFLAVLIVFFGGVQTFAIGIIGEYVAKAYLEAKHRPRFFLLSSHLLSSHERRK